MAKWTRNPDGSWSAEPPAFGRSFDSSPNPDAAERVQSQPNIPYGDGYNQPGRIKIIGPPPTGNQLQTVEGIQAPQPIRNDPDSRDELLRETRSEQNNLGLGNPYSADVFNFLLNNTNPEFLKDLTVRGNETTNAYSEARFGPEFSAGAYAWRGPSGNEITFHNFYGESMINNPLTVEHEYAHFLEEMNDDEIRKQLPMLYEALEQEFEQEKSKAIQNETSIKNFRRKEFGEVNKVTEEPQLEYRFTNLREYLAETFKDYFVKNYLTVVPVGDGQYQFALDRDAAARQIGGVSPIQGTSRPSETFFRILMGGGLTNH